MKQNDILLDQAQNNTKMYGIITNKLIPILVSNDDDDDTDSNIDFSFKKGKKQERNHTPSCSTQRMNKKKNR